MEGKRCGCGCGCGCGGCGAREMLRTAAAPGPAPVGTEGPGCVPEGARDVGIIPRPRGSPGCAVGAMEHQWCTSSGFGVFSCSHFSLSFSLPNLAVVVSTQGRKGLAEGKKCLPEEINEARGSCETGCHDQ